MAELNLKTGTIVTRKEDEWMDAAILPNLNLYFKFGSPFLFDHRKH